MPDGMEGLKWTELLFHRENWEPFLLIKNITLTPTCYWLGSQLVFFFLWKQCSSICLKSRGWRLRGMTVGKCWWVEWGADPRGKKAPFLPLPGEIPSPLIKRPLYARHCSRSWGFGRVHKLPGLACLGWWRGKLGEGSLCVEHLSTHRVLFTHCRQQSLKLRFYQKFGMLCFAHSNAVDKSGTPLDGSTRGPVTCFSSCYLASYYPYTLEKTLF